ncbi:hypothetical protein CIK05_09665 [Bdellovibrio sp. qaytius]|nr:hypothetical protein CIK05_09665 [Bdellovibrio sp. qaytius]
MKHFISEKQKLLFKQLEAEGELVFAVGPRGAVANLVGRFVVRRNHHDEDQLDVGDGTCHVHLDWSRIKKFEASDFHGEGLLTFFDGDAILFRLYRMEGPYSQIVVSMAGQLID